MNIIKYNQFNIDYFSYKKKVSLNQKYSEIPISYNKGDLIIQTPILYIPFEISSYNTLDISFTNTEDNTDIKEFHKTINIIVNKAKKKYKRKFVNPLIEDHYFPCRLRCDVSKNTSIFSQDKKILTNNKISHAKTYAKFLIFIKGLWSHKTKYGISLSILQVKQYEKKEPILEEYSFIDSDTEQEDNVDLSKYRNMKKAGVPKEAIIQKMNLDNVDSNLLFTSNIPLPPPPPFLLNNPIPNNNNHINHNNNNNNNNTSALLSSINAGNFKLKKVNHDKTRKPLKTNDNGFKISDDDLLNALGKLRKNKSTTSYV